MASVAIAAFSAAAAAAAAPALSTVGTILQGVATVGSVLAGFQAAKQQEFAGAAQQQDLELQSRLAEQQGRGQELQSQQRAVELRREAVRRVAAARVAFGASGLDISSGQLRSIENEIQSDTDFGLSIEATNRDIGNQQSGVRAERLTTQGANARAAGASRASGTRIGAIGTGARGLLSIIRRRDD